MAGLVQGIGSASVMTVSISITDTDVFSALRTFLLASLPSGTEVIQAQNNGVPMPLGGFVAMNNAGTKRLATNVDTYVDPGTNPGTKDVLMKAEYHIDLDFYGPNSAAWANTIQALFRDEYATSSFPSNIQPLYADDPVQVPFIDGEQQYEQRWRMTTVLQYDPVVSVSQDFAGTLTVGIVEIDTKYPPH